MRNCDLSANYYIRPVIELSKSNSIDLVEYNVGDIINYKSMDFYVLKESFANESTITLLKAEPLTVDEVNLYGGVGTENNHINRYTYNLTLGTAGNKNGYGTMAYYSSETCGVVNNRPTSSTGCVSDYGTSDIKFVIDAWAASNIDLSNVVSDSTGYGVRLITSDEYFAISPINNWRYSNNYWYWTMTTAGSNMAKYVVDNGNISTGNHIYDSVCVVRPVINLLKSAIN